MSKVTIAGVSCYGKWDETSNAILIGTWSDGTEMDSIWCPSEVHETWADAVEDILEWAKAGGHTIDEMQAC